MSKFAKRLVDGDKIERKWIAVQRENLKSGKMYFEDLPAYKSLAGNYQIKGSITEA